MSETMGERYEPWLSVPPAPPVVPGAAPTGQGTRSLTAADATREALAQAMGMDERVFVMGQGVDDPGGYWGCTRGLHDEFGPERCFDTPLAETSLMGVAVGAALQGMRPIYFHNRPDFLYLSMDQLINHASKWSYMFGGRIGVPLVVWACIGRGWGSAAQHSQAPHALFQHIPGLKVILPGSPRDSKGLLLEAIADPNPVIVIEHRMNLRASGEVPSEMYRTPFGEAAIRREGADVSLVALSHMVRECECAAVELERHGVNAEIVDVRTLRPMDTETILTSVARTGRVVLCDMGWKTGGCTAEIAAVLAERGLNSLKAPVVRVSCPDVPTPAGFTLEAAFYPGVAEIVAAALEICE